MQITIPKSSLAACLLSAGLLGACNIVKAATSPSGKDATAQTDAVFTDLVRYSDITTMRIQLATQEFVAKSKDPDAELQAANWRLESQRFLMQTAGGPNSTVSMLDTVVMIAVTRWLHEDYWLPKVYGDADKPILDAFTASENDGWILLQRYLDDDVVAKAREVLHGWREQNPALTPSKLIEFPNFYTLVRSQKGKPGMFDEGLLGVIGLDPLSGLEPMARQVELSRMLGLRALYFAQRAPRLIGNELDVRMMTARETPEWHQVLANLNEVTQSLARFTATTEKLPEYVRAEREGALKQVGEELTAQREGIVRDLAAAQAPVNGILEQSQAVLESTARASTALTGTVTALDTMLARLSKKEEEEPPRTPGTPEPPPSKPFDPADYGEMADHVGVAADRLGGTVRDVTALLGTLEQRLPEVQKVLDETTARGKEGIDHALFGALGVGLAIVAAWAVAAALVRRVRPRAAAAPPA
jgi:hypothetical protein